MTRLLRRFGLLSLVILLAMCSSPAEPGSRGECERCNQENGNLDCMEGLTCQGFFNSQIVVTLCAPRGQSMCDLQ